MTVTSTTSAASSLTLNPATAASNGTLDQTAFLKLMTTQLKTQDPFKPVDNTQMVAQMAQFSSVAGIAEMNASLKAIATDIASSRIGDAASWIGRSALVSTDVATPLADGSYAGAIQLPADASAVTVSLVDADGTIVHSQDLGAQAAGTIPFQWDGQGGSGDALRVVVTATGAEGAMTPGIATWTAIGGVQSPAGGGATRLVTPLGLIAPEDAIRLA